MADELTPEELAEAFAGLPPLPEDAASTALMPLRIFTTSVSSFAWAVSSSLAEADSSALAAFCWVTLSSCWIALLICEEPISCSRQAAAMRAKLTMYWRGPGKRGRPSCWNSAPWAASPASG